jgi:uncharacterized protein YyaL (SSP411 family)
VDFLAAGPREIVVAGDRDAAATREMLAVVRARFLPQRVVALADANGDAELMPILKDRSAPAGSARAFVCRHWTCKAPVDTPAALAKELD